MIFSGTVWDSCVLACSPAFTQPSLPIFQELIDAWVLCPGRHTVTRMIRMLDPAPRRKHDAYHRFLRDGVWSPCLKFIIAPASQHNVTICNLTSKYR
jgi:hypothetical protein